MLIDVSSSPGDDGFRRQRPGEMVWQVGALCRAVADSVDARFRTVAVEGEMSSFSRAGSGHCYFVLKDAVGQIRCALFRRAASQLRWTPREGERIQVRGRLTVYEARGELQLVVESMQRTGVGALYEDFLRRKAELEALGLFDSARKRPLARYPRGIGLVTSLGAAALHDVAAALRRRAPHVPVLLVPAPVQGAGAAADLVAALQRLYRLVERQRSGQPFPNLPVIDTILLVRGGGSIEDLWAFNDPALAHAIVASPVPLVSGVGHESDVTIADFCADLRAPTPTAGAELAALPAEQALAELEAQERQLRQLAQRRIDRAAQQLDRLEATLDRALERMAAHPVRWQALAQRLQRLRRTALAAYQIELERARHRWLQTLARRQPLRPHAVRLRDLSERRRQASTLQLGRESQRLQALDQRLRALRRTELQAQRLQIAERSLRLLDPTRILQRGYAILQDESGHVLTHRRAFRAGSTVLATVQDGQVSLTPLLRQTPL